MTEETNKAYRFDIEAINKLLKIGKSVSHNPNAVPNDCLYTLLGEYERLTKRVKELEQSPRITQAA